MHRSLSGLHTHLFIYTKLHCYESRRFLIFLFFIPFLSIFSLCYTSRKNILKKKNFLAHHVCETRTAQSLAFDRREREREIDENVASFGESRALQGVVTLHFRSSEEAGVPESSAGGTQKREKKKNNKRLHCRCLGAVTRTRLHFTQAERERVKTGVLQPFPARLPLFCEVKLK